MDIWVVIFTVGLLGLLGTLSYIDLKTYRLPNPLTLLLVLLGLIQAWVLGANIINNVIGMFLGYAVFFLVEKGFKAATGKDGLGRGDAKLFAGAGAWLGWMGLPLVALIASLLGIICILMAQLITKKQVMKVPFGPFLSFGIASVWVYNQFFLI